MNIKSLPVIKSKYYRKVDLRLPLGSVSLFIGSTSSGKTTNILNLITRRSMLLDYFKVFIFSRNFKNDSIWENVCIDEKYTCLEYSSSRIQKIIDRQLYLKDKHMKEDGNLSKFKPVLIILDDLIGELRDKYLSILTSQNRHYNVTIWVLSQNFKSISNIIRNQSQNIIVYPSGNTSEIVKISVENGGHKVLKFLEYISKKEYDFLHIDKKSPVLIRYRKNYDKYLTLENGKVIENDLVIPWNEKFLKSVKNKPVKLNKKIVKKKQVKKKVFFEDFFSSSDESSEESDYSESE